jgi:hypothetical protein
MMTPRTLWIFNNRLYYIDCGEIPCFPNEHKFDNSPSDKKLYNSCHQSLLSTRRLCCRTSMRLRKRISLKIVELRNQICALILNINLDRTMLITKREHILGWALWGITLPLLMPLIACIQSFWWTFLPYVCLDTVLKEFPSEC